MSGKKNLIKINYIGLFGLGFYVPGEVLHNVGSIIDSRDW